MDGWLDGWKDEWLDGWMVGCIVGGWASTYKIVIKTNVCNSRYKILYDDFIYLNR